MNTELNDQNLLAELNKSHLESAAKKILKPYISRMNREEREQLMTLIRKGEKLSLRTRALKDEAERGVNETYRDTKGKMGQAANEVVNSTRLESESTSKADDQQGLEELENQIGNIK
jgi:hypothetical protein